MVLLDLLGRRWALRIIWELRHGPLSFRALQAASENLSPSVLQTRLDELRQAEIITLADGYALTQEGQALLQALIPLEIWAENWGKRFD
jgi:DNA-binding HxlR family transcriptional regulator